MNSFDKSTVISHNIIFVDCFNTIVHRKTNNKTIFQNWAKDIEKIFGVSWKKFYSTFNKLNRRLSAKKLLCHFMLEEKLEVILEKTYQKLKNYFNVDLATFLDKATASLMAKEMETHYVNKNFVEFLKTQKSLGKKIYIVSDFYCNHDVISAYINNLGLIDIFDDIFSSSDFNKEKATTKLYRFLIKKLETKGKNILMIGDNIWSDVFMARLCGLKAKRYRD